MGRCERVADPVANLQLAMISNRYRLIRWPRLLRLHLALLAQCLFRLARFRILLSRRGYKPVLQEIRRQSGTEEPYIDPRVLVWAIRKSARIVPGASCLTQSLTAAYRLGRSGQPYTMRIGVKSAGTSSTGQGAIDAHAWVIHDGAVILGGTEQEIGAYTPIVDL